MDFDLIHNIFEWYSFDCQIDCQSSPWDQFEQKKTENKAK